MSQRVNVLIVRKELRGQCFTKNLIVKSVEKHSQSSDYALAESIADNCPFVKDMVRQFLKRNIR
jgi:hypothetical protein